MRILQLCNKPPLPAVDGGCKAMLAITNGLLAGGHDVKMLCICTAKHPFDPKAMPREFRERTGIEAIFADTSLNIVDAFTDLVTADNYNISRFFSPDMDIRLIRLLSQEKFDVILLESLFMTPYLATIRRYSRARVVLRSHNLEHVIQERLARGEKNVFKKPYRRFLAKQLKDYEIAVLARVDGVAAITPADAEHLSQHGGRVPIATIPFGLEMNGAQHDPPPGPPIFFHLGSMDWAPNEEGVRWLLESVWPRVIKKHPDAELHLAGNKMPKDLMKLKLEGTTISGHVDDASAWMDDRHVLVVPLFSAGGMRVKIIEAMALGKCVISTSIGAEGIRCTHGKDILIADNATEMVQAIGSIVADPAIATRIGKSAMKLIRDEYSVSSITRELVALFKRIPHA